MKKKQKIGKKRVYSRIGRIAKYSDFFYLGLCAFGAQAVHAYGLVSAGQEKRHIFLEPSCGQTQKGNPDCSIDPGQL